MARLTRERRRGGARHDPGELTVDVRTPLISALLGTLTLALGPGEDRRSRDYAELLHAYARGDRMEALAGLGRWSDDDLARQLGLVSGTYGFATQ